MEKVIIEEVSNGYILEFSDYSEVADENDVPCTKRVAFVEEIGKESSPETVKQEIKDERLACLEKVFDEIRIIMGVGLLIQY